MEFECSFGTVRANPQVWALEREAEGWDVISVVDHYWTEVGWMPHCFATLGAIGAVTTRAKVASGFANNLLRHPVEFAQAALTLHESTGGRFEAGLGAGWADDELRRTGQVFPSAGERAGRLIEAAEIVRRIFDGGAVRFDGQHYQVDIAGRDHTVAGAPPLVVSVGGPRTLKGVAPFVDRLELKAMSVATRGGSIDIAAMAAVTDDDLRRLVERAEAAKPVVALGLFALCRARADGKTSAFADRFSSGSLMGRFWGAPGRVFERMLELESFGISRIHVSAADAGTYAELGCLLGTRS